MSRLFGLPAMSMPLNLVAWLVLSASNALGHLSPSVERWQLVSIPAGLLPHAFWYFFSALGAVLSQVNPVSGIIHAVGLILWPHIALVLMLSGYAASFAMQRFLGIDPTSLGGYSLAFNHMFAALAIGGIFAVPSPSSLITGIVAALVSTIILTAIRPIFPSGLTPLRAPVQYLRFADPLRVQESQPSVDGIDPRSRAARLNGRKSLSQP